MTQSPALFPTLRRQFEHWLFDLPEAVGGSAMRWVMLPLRYLYALLRDLGRGELGLRAMSLVYSTLFAIVPVIAVAFAVLKAFGYHRELEPVLFEFLRPLGDQGYSLTRRARLRGRSTCHTKLSDASIFWIIDTTVKSRNAKPTVPRIVPCTVSTKPMMFLVSV